MNPVVAVLVAIILGLLGSGAGFYFGYDKGYEQAIVVLKTPVPVATIVPTPTLPPVLLATPTPTTIPETEIDPRITAANTQLIGVWQSDDDTKFKREYKLDGTVADTYTGTPTANTTGTWLLFTSDDNEKTTFQQNNTDVYIKHTVAAKPLFFRIVKVTPEALQLVNMDKGSALRFTKVK